MNIKQEMINAIDSAEALERLYHQSPQEFQDIFPEIHAQQPHNPLLNAWQTRLTFQSEKRLSIQNNLWTSISLAIIAGFFCMLHMFIEHIRASHFIQIGLPLFSMLAVSIYFGGKTFEKKRTILLLVFFFISSGTALYLIPDNPNLFNTELAVSYMPWIYWFFIGVSYLGKRWREFNQRKQLIRFTQEWIILSVLLYVCYVIFILIISSFLISVLSDVNIFLDQWQPVMFSFGVGALPVIAAFLIDRINNNLFQFSRVFSKLFTPFLLLLFAILLPVVLNNTSAMLPNDDFLHGFNALLIFTLFIATAHLSGYAENKKPTNFDKLILMVLCAANILSLTVYIFSFPQLSGLLQDAQTLAASGFNILLIIHIAGITFHLFCWINNKSTLISLQKWAVDFMFLYIVWAFFPISVFPFFQ